MHSDAGRADAGSAQAATPEALRVVIAEDGEETGETRPQDSGAAKERAAGRDQEEGAHEKAKSGSAASASADTPTPGGLPTAERPDAPAAGGEHPEAPPFYHLPDEPANSQLRTVLAQQGWQVEGDRLANADPKLHAAWGRHVVGMAPTGVAIIPKSVQGEMLFCLDLAPEVVRAHKLQLEQIGFEAVKTGRLSGSSTGNIHPGHKVFAAAIVGAELLLPRPGI